MLGGRQTDGRHVSCVTCTGIPCASECHRAVRVAGKRTDTPRPSRARTSYCSASCECSKAARVCLLGAKSQRSHCGTLSLGANGATSCHTPTSTITCTPVREEELGVSTNQWYMNFARNGGALPGGPAQTARGLRVREFLPRRLAAIQARFAVVLEVLQTRWPAHAQEAVLQTHDSCCYCQCCQGCGPQDGLGRTTRACYALSWSNGLRETAK